MMSATKSEKDVPLARAFDQANQKPKQQKKSSPRITMRLTDNELERLKKASAGTSISAYVRKMLFGKDVSLRKTRSRVTVEDEIVLAQVLGKLGESRMANNLNQLAHQANCGSLLIDESTEEEIKLACAQIAWMRVKLIEALGIKNSDQQ
ncbi:MAG: plasmid mobilization protein [Hoeflea sp.]|uniref:plasmid mobilization protein n=1 Tax=Hoeflea sp. TaxID=1940281 RepID=UPI003EF0A68B